ncbi:MAG TPA: dihydrofolate reductase family protein, partial [Vicinamibacterales bacterium]|nr:dihydrofolate reductase family protein [Vicinamibacterales bacterium]
IINAGIARVVTAMRDPDPRVNGCGMGELRAAGITVVEGVCQADAERLNAAFMRVKSERRPLVIAKAAASLDAKIAVAGRQTRISSPESNRKTHQLRASVDAIAVGSGTMLIDDPLLTARHSHRVRPLVRAIFDRRLRTPAAARVFTTFGEGPVIMVTSRAALRDAANRAAALERRGATVIAADDLRAAAEMLLQWDVSTLLVEGGACLHRAFLEASLVDRMHLIVAPCTLGADGVPLFAGAGVPRAALTLTTVEPRGSDIWIEADVHRNH